MYNFKHFVIHLHKESKRNLYRWSREVKLVFNSNINLLQVRKGFHVTFNFPITRHMFFSYSTMQCSRQKLLARRLVLKAIFHQLVKREYQEIVSCQLLLIVNDYDRTLLRYFHTSECSLGHVQKLFQPSLILQDLIIITGIHFSLKKSQESVHDVPRIKAFKRQNFILASSMSVCVHPRYCLTFPPAQNGLNNTQSQWTIT